MSGRIPKPLQAALAAMLATMGAGGGVYLAEQERTGQLQTEYLQTVAADTSTSDAIKLAMVLGSYYESSFRHIDRIAGAGVGGHGLQVLGLQLAGALLLCQIHTAACAHRCQHGGQGGL